MQLMGPEQQDTTEEIHVLTRMLELGCGGAEKTRQIAELTGVEEVVAAEVDQIQHEKNLLIEDLPKVTFASFGAEAIEDLPL